MFETFSPAARSVILRCQHEAAAAGAVGVGPEHLLAAVAAQKGSIASSILNGLGVTAEAIRHAVEAEDVEALGALGISLDSVRASVDTVLGEGTWRDALAGLELPFTEAGKAAIYATVRETRKLHQRVISPEHMVLALVAESGPVGSLLTRIGASPEEIRERLLAEVTRYHAS